MTKPFDLVLTSEASRDIQNISRWTNKNFGEHQSTIYRASIVKLAHRIAANPYGIGSHKVSVGTNPIWMIHMRIVFSRGRHLILYCVGEEKLDIVRILHDEMNIGLHVRVAETKL